MAPLSIDKWIMDKGLLYKLILYQLRVAVTIVTKTSLENIA